MANVPVGYKEARSLRLVKHSRDRWKSANLLIRKRHFKPSPSLLPLSVPNRSSQVIPSVHSLRNKHGAPAVCQTLLGLSGEYEPQTVVLKSVTGCGSASKAVPPTWGPFAGSTCALPSITKITGLWAFRRDRATCPKPHFLSL